jgi:hypothetical protein
MKGVTQADARETLDRMKGLPGFPENPVLQRQYTRVFEQADDITIARRVISLWVSDHDKFPKPSELRKLIEELNLQRREGLKGASKECWACGGTGFTIKEGRNFFSGLTVTAGVECVCRTTGKPIEDPLANNDCPKCEGHGLYSTKEHGADGPWTFHWCLCHYGVERREREYREIDEGRGENALGRRPRMVDSVTEVNVARDRLLQLKIKPQPARRPYGKQEAAVDAALTRLTGASDPRKSKDMKHVSTVEVEDDGYKGDF